MYKNKTKDFVKKSILYCGTYYAKRIGVHSSEELEDATKIIIQAVQKSEFHEEIKRLKKRLPLPKNSKLLPLNIFLEKDGINRVGGRLSQHQ